MYVRILTDRLFFFPGWLRCSALHLEHVLCGVGHGTCAVMDIAHIAPGTTVWE